MNTTPAFSAPRHIDLPDTAKLIRAQLKAAFPGQKFSVRTSRFSMGTSADISWEDGPTVAQVEAVTAAFASSRFDGSIDMGVSVQSWYCPEHGASVRHVAGTVESRGSIPAFGKIYGFCVRCALDLTDERSIAVGYGATCARNMGWPYPTLAQVRSGDLVAVG